MLDASACADIPAIHGEIPESNDAVRHPRGVPELATRSAGLVKSAAKMRSRNGRSGLKILEDWILAERVGFEPTVRFHAHTLSKRAP